MRLFRRNTSISRKILVSISYLVQVTFVIAIIIAIVNQRWLVLFVAVLALLLTLLPKILERNFRIYLPIEFQFILSMFIFASLYLGEFRDYYFKFWWWDLMLHTFSGFALGFIGFLFLYTLASKDMLKAKPGVIVLFAFCFSLAMGALWEITEFTIDSTLGTNMQKPMLGDESGLTDTMFDLIVDAIGALVAAILGYLYLKRDKGSIFDLMVKRFVESNPQLFSSR